MAKQSAAQAQASVDYVVWQREWMRAHNNIKNGGAASSSKPNGWCIGKTKSGKLSVRSFNVSKYGEEGAKQLAIRLTGKHGGGGAAIAERSDCGRDKNADPRYR